MTSNRQKGMRNERRAVKELEKEGWLIYRARGSTLFNLEVDIFGLWDILGIKQKKNKIEMILIQVKTNHKPKLDVYKKFKKAFHSIRCEVWIWYEPGKSKKYKGWRKIIL